MKKSSIKQINFILLMISFLLIIGYFFIPYAEAKYKSNGIGNNTIKVATWDFKINGVSSETLAINLIDTIVENEYSSDSVIPGSEGVIILNVDCSNSKVALNYEISLDTTKTILPENLILYTDSSSPSTSSFNTFTNYVSLDNLGTITHKIYWKWNFTDENETDTWSNKDIKVYFNTSATQRVKGDA